MSRSCWSTAKLTTCALAFSDERSVSVVLNAGEDLRARGISYTVERNLSSALLSFWVSIPCYLSLEFVVNTCVSVWNENGVLAVGVKCVSPDLCRMLVDFRGSVTDLRFPVAFCCEFRGQEEADLRVFRIAVLLGDLFALTVNLQRLVKSVRLIDDLIESHVVTGRQMCRARKVQRYHPSGDCRIRVSTTELCVVPEKSNAIIRVVTAGFECLPPSCDGLMGPDDHEPMISTVRLAVRARCLTAALLICRISGNQLDQWSASWSIPVP
ncbi:squamosa promoter-binding-like protein 7 [Dorcoceras hygrometricum]|uniref:Squamosa promoter-binding-like protein 7 n=1 Tax=Dorcoceras hygrometricum TaxID=472368 RepID=A0A2Z7C6T3_9LAMI|nr:squamosa promoter-binding-like protein 7 [Dorcoceras hygrometricum]